MLTVDPLIADVTTVKDVVVPIQEHPPPYQPYEPGERAYPTNRAANWLMTRGGIRNYAPLNERAATAATRKVTGITALMLAVPLLVLVALGSYFMMVVFIWCPTCGRHRVHVNKVTEIEARQAQVPPEATTATPGAAATSDKKPAESHVKGRFPPFHNSWFVEIIVPKKRIIPQKESKEQQPQQQQPHHKSDQPGQTKPPTHSGGIMSFMMEKAKQMMTTIHHLFDFGFNTGKAQKDKINVANKDKAKAKTQADLQNLKRDPKKDPEELKQEENVTEAKPADAAVAEQMTQEEKKEAEQMKEDVNDSPYESEVKKGITKPGSSDQDKEDKKVNRVENKASDVLHETRGPPAGVSLEKLLHRVKLDKLDKLKHEKIKDDKIEMWRDQKRWGQMEGKKKSVDDLFRDTINSLETI